MAGKFKIGDTFTKPSKTPATTKVQVPPGTKIRPGGPADLWKIQK